MIDSPGTYGMTDANIMQWLIRAFYEELWAADSDAKRAKVAFVVSLSSSDLCKARPSQSSATKKAPVLATAQPFLLPLVDPLSLFTLLRLPQPSDRK